MAFHCHGVSTIKEPSTGHGRFGLESIRTLVLILQIQYTYRHIIIYVYMRTYCIFCMIHTSSIYIYTVQIYNPNQAAAWFLLMVCFFPLGSLKAFFSEATSNPMTSCTRGIIASLRLGSAAELSFWRCFICFRESWNQVVGDWILDYIK